MEFRDVIATLALVISVANLYLYFSDIRPTLKIGFYIDEVLIEDEELGPVGSDKYYSIDIVNHSSRRIKVANILVEWKKSRWFSKQKWKATLPDFKQKGFNDFISSFWIEPWGDQSYGVSEDDFTSWLSTKTRIKSLWARVVVKDALGKSYRSQILRVW